MLPEGKTETGTWAFGSLAVPASNGLEAKTPLTFTLPLKEALEASKVHFVTKEEVAKKTAPAECAGSVEAPSAKAGSLCVYEARSKVFQVLRADR